MSCKHRKAIALPSLNKGTLYCEECGRTLRLNEAINVILGMLRDILIAVEGTKK